MKKEKMEKIDQKTYFSNFGVDQAKLSDSSEKSPASHVDSSKTFEVALSTRQFEIQMYWTRTAYFWTLIGAAFAGYFALQASDSSSDNKQFLGFTISVIGFVLSFGWGLANKGSKYWHENWENHVQMLERVTVGPIFKTLLERRPPNTIFKKISQVITGPSTFSVSKVNLIFSWFFSLLWGCLAFISLPPFVLNADRDYRYIIVGVVALAFVVVLFVFGRSWDKDQKHHAYLRKTEIVDS